MFSFECSKPQLKRKNHRFFGVENDTVSGPSYRELLQHYFFYTDGVSVESLYSCLIRLMNTNLTLHDIVEIPYPIVEIR